MRQKRGSKLNKTEAAFEAYLRGFYNADKIGVQDITLHLGNGVRYTPDFHIAGHTYYEVKGYMRDDAAVKLKVAAAKFDFFEFFLVFRDKAAPSGWRIERVLP